MVLILGFNQVGLPFFYWAKIQLCKLKAEYAEMERAASTKSLIVFSSQKKGIQQVNGSELLVAGKMYDVVKTRLHNGIRYYYVVSDSDEDTYIHKLADTEKGDRGEKSMPAKMFKLYEVKYVADVKNYDSACVTSDHITGFNVINSPFIYPVPFKDIFSPPPNLSFS
ncbi:hypothetical protein [Mucilaginibacter gotjawali]|uniref:Uncharacterized protein n=2 Tax=Mucilaginibacter gotjawali TaxID=1550579 RepID=A0A839SRR5_9SPHI|nr:hypothetical protein [Mucilaginibacter gotjawali]MBB3059047.1 hypothetical protein [Mucilaginibacter gotjawali]BAU52150.1 hypothetical protein MgSA37_00300 [Mucilaginibacter gotjawali]